MTCKNCGHKQKYHRHSGKLGCCSYRGMNECPCKKYEPSQPEEGLLTPGEALDAMLKGGVVISEGRRLRVFDGKIQYFSGSGIWQPETPTLMFSTDRSFTLIPSPKPDGPGEDWRTIPGNIDRLEALERETVKRVHTWSDKQDLEIMDWVGELIKKTKAEILKEAHEDCLTQIWPLRTRNNPS